MDWLPDFIYDHEGKTGKKREKKLLSPMHLEYCRKQELVAFVTISNKVLS